MLGAHSRDTAQRVVNAATGLHYVWVLPLEIIISMVLLFNVLSYAMFAGAYGCPLSTLRMLTSCTGLGTIGTVLFVNKAIAMRTRIASERVMNVSDTLRIRALNTAGCYCAH
jgi:hypothetical protein